MIYGNQFLNPSSYSFESILFDIDENRKIIESMKIESDQFIFTEAISFEEVKTKIKVLFDKFIDFLIRCKDNLIKFIKKVILKIKLKFTEIGKNEDKIKDLEKKIKELDPSYITKKFEFEYKNYCGFVDKANINLKSSFSSPIILNDYFIPFSDFDIIETEIGKLDYGIRNRFITSTIYYRNNEEAKQTITKMKNDIEKLYIDKIHKSIFFEDINNPYDLNSRMDEIEIKYKEPKIISIKLENNKTLLFENDNYFSLQKLKSEIDKLEKLYTNIDRDYNNHIKNSRSFEKSIIDKIDGPKKEIREFIQSIISGIIPMLTNVDKTIVNINNRIYNLIIGNLTKQIQEETRYRKEYAMWLNKPYLAQSQE